MKKNQVKQVFGLDIGTRSIVGSIGHKEDDKFVVDAIAIKEHDTRAMIDGQIHDVDKVVETIRQVKEELESQTGSKLKNVCIAAAGRVLKTVTVYVEQVYDSEIIIGDDEVYALEVEAANRAYAKLREKLGVEDESSYYLVGYSPIRYYLSGHPITKLKGHRSKKVGVELLATFLPAEVIEDLYTAVERVGLEVVNMTLEPIAAMDVAIPEKYRLLNIALVDVGAGTSDICITKDGTISAYGMIPYAGDEITEFISKKYLIDFNEAERVKIKASMSPKVTYTDIMGKNHSLNSTIFMYNLKEAYENITKNIANKIMELNGGKPTSAVFLVGGGGKAKGFVESLADYLGLDKDRVALKGDSVLEDIKFASKGVKKDSTLVTPIGILMNYYQKHNNFINLTVNGSRVKMFDNNNLAVLDVALFLGWSNEELFPIRGKSLKFTLNGKTTYVNGEVGDNSNIMINGEIANIRTNIKPNDNIVMKKAKSGKDAHKKIIQLKNFNPTITFNIDGKKLQFVRNVYVNGNIVFDDYEIQDGDDIKICDYYTTKSLLECLGVEDRVIMKDGIILDMDACIKENETINVKTKQEVLINDISEEITSDSNDIIDSNEEMDYSIYLQNYDEYENEVIAKQIQENIKQARKENNAVDTIENENNILYTKEDNKIDTKDDKKDIKFDKEKVDVSYDNVEFVDNKDTTSEDNNKIRVDVNGTRVTLSNKKDYVFVDILDVYKFDTSVVGGDKLIMNVNNQKASFSTTIKDNDEVELYWA